MFDILTDLNLNFALILMIVGITEYIKTLTFISDKPTKILQRLVPIVFSFVVGFFVTKPFGIEGFLMNGLIYFGISTLFYKSIIKLIEKYTDKLSSDKEYLVQTK